MNESLNNRPKENEQRAQGGNRAKNLEDDSRNNVKYHPYPAKDD